MELILGLVVVFMFTAHFINALNENKGVVLPADKDSENRDFTYCILEEMID